MTDPCDQTSTIVFTLRQSLLVYSTLLVAVASSAAMAGEVRIELKRRATVSSEEILLGDIARITATARDQWNLEQIDLSVFPEGEDEATIRASLIRIRLQLAGWPTDEFRIVGADEVEVRRQMPEPVSDTTIENAALAMMTDLLGVEPDALRVGLSAPFMSTLPTAFQKDTELRVEILPPTKARLGTIPLTVRLWRDQRLVSSRPGRFEVLRRQRVAVTRVSLRRDHRITVNDFQFENRFLAAPVDQLTEEQLIGQSVRSPVTVGSLLSLKDLQIQRIARPETVVKSRDKLRVIAVSGPLRVELRDAEALQSGAVGDTIRIRNLDSKRTISGRISKPGEVVIRL